MVLRGATILFEGFFRLSGSLFIMKILQNCLCVWFALLTLMGIWPGSVIALDANTPQCKMDSLGNVVAIWNEIDDSGNPILQGATMSLGIWSATVNISYSISDNITNNPPTIYSNSNGDVVVLWQYADNDTGNFYTAATMLPFGTTSWNTATLSTDDENANYGDQRLALNESGSLIAMWTSTYSGEAQIRVSTSTIGPSTTWSAPISITD